MPPASSQAVTAATGFRVRPCGMTTPWPAPSGVRLRASDAPVEAAGALHQVFDIEGDEFRAAQGAGEAEQEQGRVALPR